jgi:putative transport protein
MEPIINFFVDEPLFTLFVVAAVGYLLGEIKIKGTGLGVAAALFVGLVVGALDPDLQVPPILQTFALVLFVYTVGLASGPGFFASFRRSGLRDNAAVLGLLLVAALIVVGEYFVFQFKSTIAGGIFAGSLTNTPTLAAVTGYAVGMATDMNMAQVLEAEPVIGYSVTYPMGVLGPILAILLMQRLWKIDYRRDAERVRDMFPVEQEIYNVTAEVTNPAMVGVPLQDLARANGWRVVFGRVLHGGGLELSTGETTFTLNDLVSIIGTPENVDPVVASLGAASEVHLELDRTAYDFRRVFVSNEELVGRKLAELELPQRFHAIVTRVRRGDIELLATGDTTLELGDRVRIVAPRTQMRAISEYFGDSYKKLSEIDVFALGIGIALGLLVGAIPITLPGGITFELGAAGGPLVVALVLSALRRTGPIVWSISYSANLTIRQLSLTVFLAAVGIRSGYSFFTTLAQGGGLQIFLAGAIVSLVLPLLTLFVLYKVLKIPFALSAGMMSGIQTQPAVQSSAVSQAQNDLPNHGYALTFPMATILKIVLGQVIVAFLPYNG